MNDPIRILSIRQPWTWLIAAGHKGIENRTWSTSYRGPVLLHAGVRMDSEPIERIEYRYGVKIPRDLPRGGIVGIAGLCDCVNKSGDQFFLGPTVMHDGKIKNNYGFVMRGASSIPLLRCAGKLNLYQADEALLNRLNEHAPNWINQYRNAYNAVFSYPCNMRIA